MLLVEDSDDDALLVMRALKRGGYEARNEQVCGAEDMLAALGRQAWDVVISDHAMPGFSVELSMRRTLPGFSALAGSRSSQRVISVSPAA